MDRMDWYKILMEALRETFKRMEEERRASADEAEWFLRLAKYKRYAYATTELRTSFKREEAERLLNDLVAMGVEPKYPIRIIERVPEPDPFLKELLEAMSISLPIPIDIHLTLGSLERTYYLGFPKRKVGFDKEEIEMLERGMMVSSIEWEWARFKPDAKPPFSYLMLSHPVLVDEQLENLRWALEWELGKRDRALAEFKALRLKEGERRR